MKYDNHASNAAPPIYASYIRTKYSNIRQGTVRLSYAHRIATHTHIPKTGFVIGPVYGTFIGKNPNKRYVGIGDAQVCVTETLHPGEDRISESVASRALEEEFGFGAFELNMIDDTVSQGSKMSVWTVESYYHLSERRIPKKVRRRMDKVMLWFNPPTLEGAIAIANQVKLDFIDSDDDIVGVAVFDVAHVRLAYDQYELDCTDGC